MLIRSIGAMIAAIVVVLAATPIIKKFAIKIGAVDKPNQRRINKTPVANIGGIAIFLGFWIAVFLFGEVGQTTLWMFIGSSIILLTGLVDDILDLSPFIKLFIQISTASFIVIVADIRIDFFRIPFNGDYVGLGPLAIPLTVLWIAGITNAINFIDGLDGLAAGTSGIAASAFAFLKYNSNPAQIFMGDTGSMTLGFLLAIMSIEGLMKSATTIAIIVPVLALGLPILDSTFSIVRRLRNGRSPFCADRGHLHHRLIDHGCDQKLAVRILHTVSIFSGGIALIFVLGFNLISLVSTIFVTGFMLATFNQFRALQKQNK